MPTFGPAGVGSWAISPAVMPMLHLPGLMMPGQFGPSRRVFGVVAQQRVVDLGLVLGRDALGDAHDEADAGRGGLEDRGRDAFGGTATNDARSAPVAATASATVSKTGMPSTSCPPLPGVTPATTWVP